MLLLKINLSIGILMLIFLSLSLLRAGILLKKSKYKDVKGNKSSSKMLYLARTVIISIIPFLNLLFLLVFMHIFLLADEKWFEEKVFNKLEE